MKKTKNLSQKLLPVFFLSSLIPICLFALMTQIRLRTTMKNNWNTQLETGMEKADQCLNMVLDKYKTLLYDFCTDDDIIGVSEKIISNQDNLDVSSNALRRRLSHICNRNEAVEGMIFQMEDGSRIFYDRDSSSSVNSDWIKDVIIPEFEGLENYQADGEAINSQSQTFHSFQIIRKLINYKNITKQIGKISMVINADVLREAVNAINVDYVYLINNGKIIVSPNEEEIGMDAKNLVLNEYESVKRVNEKSGWTILTCYSLASYEKTLKDQTVFLFFISGFTIIILLVFIYYFTNPMIDALNEVVQGMNRLQKGDFKVKIPINPDMPAEIQKIDNGFNAMKRQIEKLMEENKQAVLEQKNAEIVALEYQIDPHFLYNTLDTINWKAIENEQDEISEMVGILADILRYSVKNTGEEVSMSKELSWLQKYISLQEIRLDKKLEVNIHISKELENCKIHKLILQPFVENAINHGLYRKKDKCILNVSIEEAAKQVHIIIEDNGKGIPEKTLKILNDETKQSGEHIGISNVRKRLKLYYSTEASIYFESKQNDYTKVHLFIPEIIREQEVICENCNCRR